MGNINKILKECLEHHEAHAAEPLNRLAGLTQAMKKSPKGQSPEDFRKEIEGMCITNRDMHLRFVEAIKQALSETGGG